MNLSTGPLTIIMYVLAFLLTGAMTGSNTPTAPVDQGQVAVPSSASLVGKVVALDAGHGGPDLGAKGPAGSLEKENTMATVRRVKKVLEDAGARVVLTRDGDYQPGYGRVTDDLWDKSSLLGYRATLATQQRADVFVSIHNDSNTNRSMTGTTTYYWGATDLAHYVENAVVGHLGSRSLGIIKKGFYVLVKTPMPAILVEVGFISNSGEERLLGDPAYQQKVALGIRDGLSRYFANS